MSMALKYAMKKKMAKGGAVREAGVNAPVHGSSTKSEHERGSGMSQAGEHVRGAQMAKENGMAAAHGARIAMAKRNHQKTLSEIDSMKGKDRTNLAEGGCVSCAAGRCMAHGGLVDRIIDKRSAKPDADFESNDFDALDDMSIPDEADYTGENSGDDEGNETLDDADQDLVSKIMRSRAKKDRLPRPA